MRLAQLRREQHADASSCGLSRLARQHLDSGWMSAPQSLRPYQVLISAQDCGGIPLRWLLVARKQAMQRRMPKFRTHQGLWTTIVPGRVFGPQSGEVQVGRPVTVIVGLRSEA